MVPSIVVPYIKNEYLVWVPWNFHGTLEGKKKFYDGTNILYKNGIYIFLFGVAF